MLSPKFPTVFSLCYPVVAMPAKRGGVFHAIELVIPLAIVKKQKVVAKNLSRVANRFFFQL